MSKVIVDDELRTKLNGLNGFGEDVELCDSSGATLAFVVSPSEYLKVVYARARERFSDADIERLSNQTGGRPLKDILRDLGAA